MRIDEAIDETRKLLKTTFDAIDKWFDKEEQLRRYKPGDGGWSIGQVLEHIGLANHFLLILINKGAEKALVNMMRMDLQAELLNYHFHKDKLAEIGMHRSFPWMRPDHMEPLGDKEPAEVRELLRLQQVECLAVLEKLKRGEGVLYKTMMSVNNLGRLDVYEYLNFLARHGQRHLEQMRKAELEYCAHKNS